MKRYGINLLYLTPQQVGGTQTYAEELIKNIIPNLHTDEQLVLYCAKNNAHLFKENQQVRIRVLPIDSSNYVTRYIIENTFLPTLLFEDKVEALLSLGYTKPLISTCKNVVTIHDLNWYYHPENYSPINGFIWKLICVLSAKTADKIIAISSTTKSSIVNILKIPSNIIEVIYHGYIKPIQYDQKSVNEVLSKYVNNNPYIFSVLSHYPHKNIETLIQSFIKVKKKNRNLKLLIAGTGTSKAKQDRVAYISQKNQNDVALLPYLSKTELEILYQNCMVYISPSKYEGFGLPILEAISNKAPVIASNIPVYREILGSKAMLFKPTDVNELSKIVEKIISHVDIRSKTIQSQHGILKKFSWKISALKTLDTIRSMNQK
ncbi:hypothetical protein DCC61_03875 [Candidatus Microgenomates bacterium]|nr:MAG: hypothetical protein DCC61_03875 [Candidatus Microgenomates bacterium]